MMSGYDKHGAKIGLYFEFMCKGGNNKNEKFIKEISNHKRSLLCGICERKYYINLYVEEKT